MARKKIYRIFGRKKGKRLGDYYSFLSTSRRGAEQQARRKYKLKILK